MFYKEKIKQLETDIKFLQWQIDNPPLFKQGNRMKYKDHFIKSLSDNEITIKIKNISRLRKRQWGEYCPARYYYAEKEDGTVIEIRENDCISI